MTQPPTNLSDRIAALGPVASAVLTDDIFSAMGLDELPDDEKAELYRTMVATVMDRIYARILDTLTADEREQLRTLLSRPDTSQVEPFVRAHVPDLDALVNEETLLYKTEMVQNARHIRTALGLKDEYHQSAAGTSRGVAERLPTGGGGGSSTLPAVVGEELPVVAPPAVPPAVYHPDQTEA